MGRLKVASLFCGCGGTDMGLLGDFTFLGKYYPSNNMEIVYANDIDDNACRLFEENGVEYEWHYIDVSEETWKRNIEKRNAAYHDGAKGVYYVDEGLLEKLQSLFEEPERGEMDVWYVNEW